MNDSAIQLKITQRLNKLASNDYDNIESWQIIEAFNKAQVDWCRRNLHGVNTKQEGDEQSTRRKDDLQVLLSSVLLNMNNKQTYYERVNFPTDYLQWKRISTKAKLFFKHIFVNRTTPYFFEDNGNSDWMSRHFFSGGIIPSDDLPLVFQNDLHFVQRWHWDGRHYEKTSNAWPSQMDKNRDALWPVFIQTYGKDQAQAWWQRWRIFFMACAELFGYDRGQQWFVSHFLFEKPDTVNSKEKA